MDLKELVGRALLEWANGRPARQVFGELYHFGFKEGYKSGFADGRQSHDIPVTAPTFPPGSMPTLEDGTPDLGSAVPPPVIPGGTG